MAKTRRKHFKIDELPDELRAAVLDRFHAGETYAQITEFIRASPSRPAEISVSPAAVARYGQDFTARFERYRTNFDKIEVLVRHLGLDPVKLQEGGTQLILHQLLERLMSMDPEALEAADPIELINAFSDMQKSSVQRERLNIQRRDEKRKEEDRAAKKAAAAASEVTAKARKGGLSEETIREIEERILGIAR